MWQKIIYMCTLKRQAKCSELWFLVRQQIFKVKGEGQGQHMVPIKMACHKDHAFQISMLKHGGQQLHHILKQHSRYLLWT